MHLALISTHTLVLISLQESQLNCECEGGRLDQSKGKEEEEPELGQSRGLKKIKNKVNESRF